MQTQMNEVEAVTQERVQAGAQSDGSMESLLHLGDPDMGGSGMTAGMTGGHFGHTGDQLPPPKF